MGSQPGRYHRRVRRLIKIALIALGIRWFLRWRKRRREQAELASAPATAPVGTAESDPADELRQKLAESRADKPEQGDAESVAEEAVEDRRAAVHEQGRAALDEMSSSDES
jgi:hypothetical protein